MIILDFGSGNTCRNDKAYVTKMIDQLIEVDTGKHNIVIKFQLFEQAGDNIPLDWDVFGFAVCYAELAGYEVTASIFDERSLKFLLSYDVPFVKIANRSDLYWLVGEMPRKIPVFASFPDIDTFFKRQPPWMIEHMLWCVSKYPATVADYDAVIGKYFSAYPAISDHTTNFELYHKYKPSIYEVHYRLEDSTGLDSGAFARTPVQLSEIL